MRSCCRLSASSLVILGVVLALGLAGCAVSRSGLMPEDAGPPVADAARDMPAPPADLGDLGGPIDDLGVDPPTDMPVITMDSGVDAGSLDFGFDSGPPDLGCTGADTCIGGVRAFCMSGVRVMEPCALGCATTTPGRCALFLPSNVDAALFSTDSDVVLPATVDTTACSLAGAVIAEQPSGPGLCVVRGRDITVPVGTTVRVSGSRALVLLAARDIVVDGVLDAAARGTVSGPGASAARAGAGGDGAHVDTFGDGGGGGGGRCGAGGAGGRGTGDAASSPAAAPGGAGGAVVDVGTLSPLFGGSPGGRGAYTAGVISPLAAGGGGGGAVQLSARELIRVRGIIDVGGGGGQRGHARGFMNYSGGGGGGSGGAVLIEAPEVLYEMGGRVQAIGGGGASSGGSNTASGTAAEGIDGNDGQDGVAASDRALGGANPASRYSTVGAPSGGGSALAGDTGGAQTARYGNGGGGGGGAGCVLVRTATGAIPAGASASAPSGLPALSALPVLRD